MEPKEKIKFDWTRLILTSVYVMLAALVVGGTTWYVMEQNARDIKESNDRVVANLQEQINKLEKTEPKSSQTATTESKTIKDIDPLAVTGEDTNFGRFLATNYMDLNSDGKQEAIVTFQLDGTGSYKDVYIVGVVDNKAKVLYSKKSLSKAEIGFSNTTPQFLVASWVDLDDEINKNKSNSELVLSKQMNVKWNGTTFIEEITSVQ